jgi:hypothetical protein
VSSGAPEILHVERSGGFGGVTVSARVPLAELSPGERAAIEECLQHPSSPPSGPDRFVYRFRAHGREAIVQEDALPVELQPLLDRLAGVWT